MDLADDIIVNSDGVIIEAHGFVLGEEVNVIPFDDMPDNLSCVTEHRDGKAFSYCYLRKRTVDELANKDDLTICRILKLSSESYVRVYVRRSGQKSYEVYVSTEMLTHKKDFAVNEELESFLMSLMSGKE